MPCSDCIARHGAPAVEPDDLGADHPARATTIDEAARAVRAAVTLGLWQECSRDPGSYMARLWPLLDALSGAVDAAAEREAVHRRRAGWVAARRTAGELSSDACAFSDAVTAARAATETAVELYRAAVVAAHVDLASALSVAVGELRDAERLLPAVL